MEQDYFSFVSTMFSLVIAVNLIAFLNTGNGCHASYLQMELINNSLEDKS